MVINDNDVQKALDHLRFKAGDAAKAKANRIYLEEYRKSLKASIMKDHISLNVNAQEREAYSDEAYKTHLKAMRAAIEEDELHRWKMVAAQAIIDAWRTEQANRRGESRIG
jgi:preprotein translocase subunit SecD